MVGTSFSFSEFVGGVVGNGDWVVTCESSAGRMNIQVILAIPASTRPLVPIWIPQKLSALVIGHIPVSFRLTFHQLRPPPFQVVTSSKRAMLMLEYLRNFGKK
ncbi:hypothetical protein Acr_13g0006690 [Actinidia rufa]|uniref:Uncharacterized protein n=1 Tax=Actinidia rufa TaxID=165716 RepID=A0A7J0FKP2_9ERIC|nr:hypothetical protein Acr_13g0006690 [Actinidia rufa]